MRVKRSRSKQTGELCSRTASVDNELLDARKPGSGHDAGVVTAKQPDHVPTSQPSQVSVQGCLL